MDSFDAYLNKALSKHQHAKPKKAVTRQPTDLEKSLETGFQNSRYHNVVVQNYAGL